MAGRDRLVDRPALASLERTILFTYRHHLETLPTTG
jgi:hypothetical protein